MSGNEESRSGEEDLNKELLLNNDLLSLINQQNPVSPLHLPDILPLKPFPSLYNDIFLQTVFHPSLLPELTTSSNIEFDFLRPSLDINFSSIEKSGNLYSSLINPQSMENDKVFILFVFMIFNIFIF
jgi:hypothetical protein